MARPFRPASEFDLIEHLRSQGIRDSRVLRAIESVPRDRFLPPEVRHLAREDRAVPIGLDQTCSQPYMVALMTQELALRGGERVLEIGTGSGYQTAILSLLAAEVFTIERHGLLSLRARSVLDGLGASNVRYRTDDGSLGWPEAAPFDRILVTAGAPAVPATLFQQLAEGGILVAPIGDEETQHLTILRKENGRAQWRQTVGCRFVKLIGAEGWSQG